MTLQTAVSSIEFPKAEQVHDGTYRTRSQARRGLFQYIESFYNSLGLHSSLGYQSVAVYEQAYYWLSNAA